MALGRPARILEASFTPSPSLGELIVLSPICPFTAGQARQVLGYLEGGGVLVYAAEHGDPELDRVLGVQRPPEEVTGLGTGVASRLPGVGQVVGAPLVVPLLLGAGQLALVRNAQGAVLAMEEVLGRGRAVVLADPLPLCNGYLEQGSNWRLAAGLLALAPRGRAVAFDEYHHQQLLASSPAMAWLSAPWVAGLIWAVLAAFISLTLHGRAFGPRLELPGVAPRSSSEYVAAVGRLLRRSRAGPEVASVLVETTRRRLAARWGLGPGLEGLAPAEAAELAAAQRELARPTEASLLSGAIRLQRLARPWAIRYPPRGLGRAGGPRPAPGPATSGAGGRHGRPGAHGGPPPRPSALGRSLRVGRGRRAPGHPPAGLRDHAAGRVEGLDVEAGLLSPAVVERYLELKERGLA